MFDKFSLFHHAVSSLLFQLFFFYFGHLENFPMWSSCYIVFQTFTFCRKKIRKDRHGKINGINNLRISICHFFSVLSSKVLWVSRNHKPTSPMFCPWTNIHQVSTPHQALCQHLTRMNGSFPQEGRERTGRERTAEEQTLQLDRPV